MADLNAELAARIRAAYEQADLAGLAPLLADEVHWGDDGHPNRCRGRAEVLATYARAADAALATVGEVRTGPLGVALRLQVRWSEPAEQHRGRGFFQVFLLSGGQISEIRRYDDRRSALAAITG